MFARIRTNLRRVNIPEGKSKDACALVMSECGLDAKYFQHAPHLHDG